MQHVLIFLGFGPISESYQTQGGLSPENSTHACEQENLSAIHSSPWTPQVHFEPLRSMARDSQFSPALVALQPHCETNGGDDGEAISREGPEPDDSTRQAAAMRGFTRQCLVSPGLLGLCQLRPHESWDLPTTHAAPTMLVGASGTISSSVVSAEAGTPHPTEECAALRPLFLGRRCSLWAGD